MSIENKTTEQVDESVEDTESRVIERVVDIYKTYGLKLKSASILEVESIIKNGAITPLGIIEQDGVNELSPPGAL